jgi:UDP-N-acetylmuramate dehydrogenase
MKLAAGWLIEQCGWKGKRIGDAAVHDKQALVIVNLANATGKELFDLSEQIKESVFEKFGITLEREVEVI